jgi:hypothetical protein
MAAFAQTKKVEIFRCTRFGIAKADEATGKLGEWTYKETNAIIRINVAKQEIILPADKDFTLYIVRQVSSVSKVDSDGDKYIYSVFDAVDQDGNECVFTKHDYPEYTDITFTVIYYTFVVIYQCNIIINE